MLFQGHRQKYNTVSAVSFYVKGSYFPELKCIGFLNSGYGLKNADTVTTSPQTQRYFGALDQHSFVCHSM